MCLFTVLYLQWERPKGTVTGNKGGPKKKSSTLTKKKILKSTTHALDPSITGPETHVFEPAIHYPETHVTET